MPDTDDVEELKTLGAPEIAWIADHVQLYFTDPAKALLWDSTVAGGPGPLPTLLLETVGNKTGKPRPRPLLFTEHEGGYVIAASKGGSPTDPAWYVNLLAMNSVPVRVGEDQFEASWRLLSDEEREEVWPVMVSSYPPYAVYKAATERNIPLVFLSRK